MHALKCCINEASLCFCHGAVFIRLFSEDQSSKLSSTEKTKNEEFTFSKAKRPSSTVTVVLQIKKLYRVDICDRNTSSIACNEHIQTVMGQQKMQNLPALAQCRTNVMGQRWADEQTLGWPMQYLQPWANRAASDGPMEGQCIRAIWVGCKDQFHVLNPTFSFYMLWKT